MPLMSIAATAIDEVGLLQHGRLLVPDGFCEDEPGKKIW
jgi:hypothetical protein